MVISSWMTASLGAVGLLFSADGAVAKSVGGPRRASSPGYSSFDVCPERCSVSGPKAGNWSVHPDFRKIRKCTENLFYEFSLYDPVDIDGSPHRIHACSSFGPDFTMMPASTARIAAVESVDIDFDIGWWGEGFGLAVGAQRSLIKQMRKYIDRGHGDTDTPFIMFGQSGQATMGVYIGNGLLHQGLSDTAMKRLEDYLATLNVSTPSLAMQLCGPGYDSSHIFGAMLVSDGTFSHIQDAMKTWNSGECLSFSQSISFAGQAQFTTPLGLTNGTTPTVQGTNFTSTSRVRLHARAECRTVQVVSGDSCAALATRCGISGADFTKYNPGDDFCAKLRPKQHVCCSSGDLPDFTPPKNPDGSCFSYQVKPNDNCDDLAAEWSLTRDKIEDFNKKTWGWNGCQLLFTDTIMCLSEGTPPFPAVIPNAVCGPQKPGSTPPTDGSDISDLNPCPLKACCNIWGQCGITKDFCVDTNTGAPGTAEPGTYGCISNCGTDVIRGTGSGAIKIAYFEGYGMGRPCLYQDASQVDTSAYTHIHFAFGTLTPDYAVQVGDELSSYQFAEFKRIKNAKKILSFGGWDFSTLPATYFIFREGVTAANRVKMATNIANFIKEHGLDGVDIDWEYPGAPDLPGIPAASLEDGPNYLAFLVLLKNLLPGKTVSIAAPSSYWYLKQYPIEAIGKVVDYIVFMTYDLHGQWDADNAYSQEGCDTGNCLRSQVNLTETKQSLAMITKAGVPGAKVIVGVTSYGRSFKMADPGCWGPNCLFTGDRLNSQAAKGVCTGTAGYIADAEIGEIMNGNSRAAGRVVTSFVDASSNSDILVYDDGEWVSWMSPSTKKTRAALYSAWGMGGTTDWASDLQTYHDVPSPVDSWASFKQLVMGGFDPKLDTRTGNWTELTCTAEHMVHDTKYTPSERWKAMDGDGAWNDVRSIYEKTDKPNGVSFIKSAIGTLKADTECEVSVLAKCDAIGCPDGANGPLSGPVAKLVWNSLAEITEMFSVYRQALFNSAAITSTALRDLENKFAPIPPEPDNTWLLLLIDLITVGTLASAAPFFNNFLKALPAFKEGGALFDNVKDTTMNMIGQSTTIAKDLLPSPGNPADWTPEDQDKFSNYMGQVVSGWANVTSLTLDKLFDGSPGSLDIIGETIARGALADGRPDDGKPSTKKRDEASDNNANILQANIQKAFFGYAIPALWQASSAYAFIIDSGSGCDADRPVHDYLSDADMAAMKYCDKEEDRLYYLARVEGDSQTCVDGCADNKFSRPPGVDSLDGTNFGGVTVEDLIKGSVRTYKANGGKNGADHYADPEKQATIDDLVDRVDITTPGFVRLPVCSPARAWQSWDTSKKGSSANYPCDVPPGKDLCGDSTFEDQTSGASALVDDCRTIIRNIEGDATTDFTTPVVGKNQRELVHFGTCSFGVEATKVDGNSEFYVGGQDIIDIINEAIKRFGGSGKVGAKGDMRCNGIIKQQDVKWGIY